MIAFFTLCRKVIEQLLVTVRKVKVLSFFAKLQKFFAKIYICNLGIHSHGECLQAPELMYLVNNSITFQMLVPLCLNVLCLTHLCFFLCWTLFVTVIVQFKSSWYNIQFAPDIVVYVFIFCFHILQIPLMCSILS